MVQPENRIECRVIQLRHVPIVTTDHTMNRIVYIFKRCIGSRVIQLPFMVAKGSKIGVVRICEENIDILLE